MHIRGGAQWQEHGSDESSVYVGLCRKSLYAERVRATRAYPLSFIEYFLTPIRVISFGVLSFLSPAMTECL